MAFAGNYFHYLLTGKKTCEYTEATTGQLVNAETKDWDYELIDKLGYPRKMFQKLIMPGTSVGHFTINWSFIIARSFLGETTGNNITAITTNVVA